jgi:hypothetical protein
MSKAKEKIEQKQMEANAFILQTKEERAKARWEDAQLKAATAQSVLDYAIEQYEAHKEELEKDIITQTEEQITARTTQIRDFLMSEKDIYLESMGIQAD